MCDWLIVKGMNLLR